MKAKVVILALMYFPFNDCLSQKADNFWLKQGISAATMAYAGWLHGTNEVKVHDYRRFQAKRPNANPAWHNPKISHKRKYKNAPNDMSPAYFGSTTFLAWTTDQYHLNATIKNVLIVGNIGLSMSLYEKPNWKQIVLQAATSWAFYALGTGAAHAYYKPIN